MMVMMVRAEMISAQLSSNRMAWHGMASEVAISSLDAIRAPRALITHSLERRGRE